MAGARFNPLSYANSLEAAGFNRAQAEALAQGFADLRAGMQDMELRLREEMAGLRLEMREMHGNLRAEIANSKVELIKWMVGPWMLQAATTLTLVFATIKVFA